MPDDARPLTTPEVALHVRVSFRQLDYWVRSGYLPIEYTNPGSGVRRLWSAAEIAHAEVFASLMHAGVDPKAIAEALPSSLVGDEWFAVKLGRLTVSGPVL